MPTPKIDTTLSLFPKLHLCKFTMFNIFDFSITTNDLKFVPSIPVPIPCPQHTEPWTSETLLLKKQGNTSFASCNHNFLLKDDSCIKKYIWRILGFFIFFYWNCRIRFSSLYESYKYQFPFPFFYDLKVNIIHKIMRIWY